MQRKFEESQSLKVRHAARLLDVSTQTLLKMVHAGLIEAYRLPSSGHIRVKISEIQRIQKAQ